MTTEDKRRLMNDFILQVRACDSRILNAFRNEDSTTATSEHHKRSALLHRPEHAADRDELPSSAVRWRAIRRAEELELVQAVVVHEFSYLEDSGGV